MRNHLHVQDELEDFLVPHTRSGEVTPDETISTGFERTVGTFLEMLRGENVGKAIVRVV